jgi:hypothetical protein
MTTGFGTEHASVYSVVLGGLRVGGEMLGKEWRRDFTQCSSSLLHVTASGRRIAVTRTLRSGQFTIPVVSPASENGVPRSCSR